MGAFAEPDVVVVGAGPSGTAAAIRLATLGYRVALVERDSFPRSHVGICLSDPTVALLFYLGVGAAFMESGFWRRGCTAVAWGNLEIKSVEQPGYHVDRAIFDQLLLEHARKLGVTMHQPCQLKTCQQSDSGEWRLQLNSLDGELTLTPRFLVDASGRRSVAGGPRVKDGPPLLAMHATWSLDRAPRFDGLVEAGLGAWMWYARTAPRQAMLSVFCDPRQRQHGEPPLRRYLDLLGCFRVLQPQLDARLLSPLVLCDASSHHAANPVGLRHVCVGDANLAVDPLSAQGVHLALQSGLQGAIVANTILAKPANATSARQFYRERSTARVQLYQNRTRSEYARVAATCAHTFWAERAAGAFTLLSQGDTAPPVAPRPEQRVGQSPEIRIAAVPVIDGDFVEVRNTVQHGAGDAGIGFVDGLSIADLLSVVPTGTAFSSLPSLWSQLVPPNRGNEIANWLWAQRILVPADFPLKQKYPSF